MEELDFDLPEDFLTPEEMERFRKLQSDADAFYEKHGEHLQWLEQAHGLGLMEKRPLTPDEQQYIQAMSKVVKNNNLTEVDEYDALKAALERVETLAHIKSEATWFQNLIVRKRIEAGKGLIEGMQTMLASAEAYALNHPEDDELKQNIQKLKQAIEFLVSDTTTSALKLPVQEGKMNN